MSKQDYSRSKGREAENSVVDYLRQRGFQAERRRQTGAQDCGDIGGVPGWVVEVKAEKRINLPAYLDELAQARINAEQRFGGRQAGFVVCKRRGDRYPGNWYAVVTLDEMVNMLQAMQRAQP